MFSQHFYDYSVCEFLLLYVAEAGHMLIRNVNYEIPSLKRQIAKCQQTQRVSYFNFGMTENENCFRSNKITVWNETHSISLTLNNYFVQECTRKESEYASNATNFKDKFHHICKQMGIKVSCFKLH